ncbi:AraC family transcriptional regulator [Kosakonia sacchari]|uniref:helix-turn-helix transcriptional regulator n=1 Tax=Kosakonia sacchari TaxID=1158459 RepID=UPI003F56B1B2
MSMTRDIQQSFCRPQALPGVELRSTWRSRQAYKRHRHAELSIGAIVEGQTRCLCNGQEYLLQPGDLMVIPPHAPHSCNPFAGQPRSYHMLYLPHENSQQQVIRDPVLFQLYMRIVALIERDDSLPLPAALDALLSALPRGSHHCTLLRPVSQQVLAALTHDLQQPPTLDALASAFSLRKETLIRTFRQDTGLTPGSFLNIARVEFAKSRLRAGDTLADVGYQSGFADQSHFHRTFVNYTAATPRQYAFGRSISDNK